MAQQAAGAARPAGRHGARAADDEAPPAAPGGRVRTRQGARAREARRNMGGDPAAGVGVVGAHAAAEGGAGAGAAGPAPQSSAEVVGPAGTPPPSPPPPARAGRVAARQRAHGAARASIERAPARARADPPPGTPPPPPVGGACAGRGPSRRGDICWMAARRGGRGGAREARARRREVRGAPEPPAAFPPR